MDAVSSKELTDKLKVAVLSVCHKTLCFKNGSNLFVKATIDIALDGDDFVTLNFSADSKSFLSKTEAAHVDVSIVLDSSLYSNEEDFTTGKIVKINSINNSSFLKGKEQSDSKVDNIIHDHTCSSNVSANQDQQISNKFNDSDNIKASPNKNVKFKRKDKEILGTVIQVEQQHTSEISKEKAAQSKTLSVASKHCTKGTSAAEFVKLSPPILCSQENSLTLSPSKNVYNTSNKVHKSDSESFGKNKSNFILTNQRKISERQFQCLICFKVFTIQTNLTRHQRKVHKKPCRSSLDCIKYGSVVSNTDDEEKTTEQRSVAKSNLNKEEESFSSVSVEMNSEENICNVTVKPSTFGLIQDIMIPEYKSKYLSVQDAKGFFTCPLCGRKFSYSTNLQRHLKSFHDGARIYRNDAVVEDEENTTDISAKKISKYGRLKDQHGKYICPLCSKKFAFSCNLRRHMRTVHSNMVFEEPVQSSDGESNWFQEQVEIVEKSITKHQSMDRNYISNVIEKIEEKYREKQQQSSCLTKFKRNRSLFLCKICGKNCFSASNVYYHKKIKHSLQKVSPIRRDKNTSLAQESKSIRSSLAADCVIENTKDKEADVFVSTADKIQNSCDMQSIKCATKKDLALYIPQNSPAKSDENPFRSADKDKLKSRYDIRRRFVCKECQKAFTFRTNLTRHVRQMHKSSQSSSSKDQVTKPKVQRLSPRPLLPAPIASKAEKQEKTSMNFSTFSVQSLTIPSPAVFASQENTVRNAEVKEVVMPAMLTSSHYPVHSVGTNYLSLSNSFPANALDEDPIAEVPKNYSHIYPVENGVNEGISTRLLLSPKRDNWDSDLLYKDKNAEFLASPQCPKRLVQYQSPLSVAQIGYSYYDNFNYYPYGSLLQSCSPISSFSPQYPIRFNSYSQLTPTLSKNNTSDSIEKHETSEKPVLDKVLHKKDEQKSVQQTISHLENSAATLQLQNEKNSSDDRNMFMLKVCENTPGNEVSVDVPNVNNQHDSLNSHNSSTSAMIDVVNLSHENSASNIEDTVSNLTQQKLLSKSVDDIFITQKDESANKMKRRSLDFIKSKAIPANQTNFMKHCQINNSNQIPSKLVTKCDSNIGFNDKINIPDAIVDSCSQASSASESSKNTEMDNKIVDSFKQGNNVSNQQGKLSIESCSNNGDSEKLPVLGFYDMLSPSKSLLNLSSPNLDLNFGLQFSPSQSPLATKHFIPPYKPHISPSSFITSRPTTIPTSPFSSTPYLIQQPDEQLQHKKSRRRLCINDSNDNQVSVENCTESVKNSTALVQNFTCSSKDSKIEKSVRSRTLSNSSSQKEFVDIEQIISSPEKYGISTERNEIENVNTSHTIKNIASKNVENLCIKTSENKMNSNKTVKIPSKENVSSKAMSNKYRFSCQICPAKFTFRTNLTRHMKKQHGVTPSDDLVVASS